jgi:predicted nucleic acid-binding protein
VPERPAVNASPLIFLSRSSHLGLLRLAGEELVVPAIVAEEIGRRGSADPTAVAIESTPWLVVVETPPIPPIIQAWDLGPGESAALSWSYSTPGTEAIIDDLAGRRCAATLGIPVRGTLGIVLLAKRRGVIPAARRVIEDLRRSGMYLSDRVMDEALALVGE